MKLRGDWRKLLLIEYEHMLVHEDDMMSLRTYCWIVQLRDGLRARLASERS